MSQLPQSLVGSVVERPGISRSPSKITPSASSTGFPTVHHRSKSAFARSRETRQNGKHDAEGSRRRNVPTIQRSGTLLSGSQDLGRPEKEGGNGDPSGVINISVSQEKPLSPSLSTDEGRWKAQMRQDNDRAIEAMSEDERKHHRTEILEQLGPNVGELLRKAREARVEKQAEYDLLNSKADNLGVNGEHGKKRHRDETEILQPSPNLPHSLSKLISPRGILVSNTPPCSRSSTPGKTARKLRFAEVTPSDVHIFQSEPPSPRRPIGLLPPPPPEGNSQNSAAGKLLIDDIGRSQSGALLDQLLYSKLEPEEGTPEDIRRRFFPHLSPNDPTLEWIETNDPSEQEEDIDSEPRFDLTGSLIPVAQRTSLPTYLGLHHHGGPAAAGYTFADLLLLARSSVPAQRATVLGVLAKLMRKVARKEYAELNDCDGMRSKSLAVGLAALAEKGSLAVQAVDLIWTCIVFWDEDLVDGLEGVELRPLDSKMNQPQEEIEPEHPLMSPDILSSIPFHVLLPQLVAHFDIPNLPSESLTQLLAISFRLVRHSVAIATAFSETPRLVANIVHTFLLTPIPPVEGGPLPDPLALRLLCTLAHSSRVLARSLEGPADALLRFITTATPPSASPFPIPLAEALLCRTLELYAALAKYGIYASVATTAAEQFGQLSAYIFSGSEVSAGLRVAWLRLLSEWLVCARDPHRTTPTHDLLWSQVFGWTWGEDLLAFRKTLLSEKSSADVHVWGLLWGALAAWLEGCRVNSAKSGSGEQNVVSAAVEEAWGSGPGEVVEKVTVVDVIHLLRQELSSPFASDCTPQQLTDKAERIGGFAQTLGGFTRLCEACIQIRDVDPGGGTAVVSSAPAFPWVLEAFSLLTPLAHELVSNRIWDWNCDESDNIRSNLLARTCCLRLRSASNFLSSFARLSSALSSRAECSPLGLAILERLLPGDEESAQYLVDKIIRLDDIQNEHNSKLSLLLPFFKHMIRPDEDIYVSPLFSTSLSIQLCTTQCLPADYLPNTNSRQARFGLPLSRMWPCIALDHLLRSGTSPVLTNPESVPDSWSASETELVQASLSLLAFLQGKLGSGDLRGFSLKSEHVVFTCMKIFMLEHNQQQGDSSEEVFRDTFVDRLMNDLLKPFSFSEAQRPDISNGTSSSLEDASKEFLGAGTPFYQFYTDFVALYDAVSFSHRAFARLLLPPTSMAYALDYRKHLWGDFGHVLRTIQTPIDDVLTHDLNVYLWPFEADAEMVGWYLRALIKWPLSGFVRFLAIHHVSCNIWSDLQEGSGPAREKRARMLFLAVVNQARPDVVKDIICYTQSHRAGASLPPACFKCDEDRRAERLACVREWNIAQVTESLEKLFSEH
ncbi:hypothetical protein M0805_003454 [Coniferiporia weirii]|nr:hypothetical protein M0805_003454 [Coniferiporia weirii]